MICAGRADTDNCLVSMFTAQKNSMDNTAAASVEELNLTCHPSSVLLQNDDSVMVCDGKLQGVQWFANGCKDPARSSTYTKLCLYHNWIRGIMNNHTPTTLPPTTIGQLPNCLCVDKNVNAVQL